MDYQDTDIDLGNLNASNQFKLSDFQNKFTSIQNYINGTRTKVNYLSSNLSNNYYTKSDVDDKVSHNVNFTYIVDSDQALKDWAENKAGNDYTSILIKKCPKDSNNEIIPWTYLIYLLSPSNPDITFINLSTTKTKFIKAEPGSRIYLQMRFGREGIGDLGNGHITFFKYNTLEESKNCRIEDLDLYLSYTRYNVALVSLSYKGFVNCSNIYNCNCGVRSTINHNPIPHYIMFDNCYNLRNINIFEGYLNSTIENCKNVMYCNIAKGYFDNSYSSPTVDSTYACTNTLNGGFNSIG